MCCIFTVENIVFEVRLGTHGDELRAHVPHGLLSGGDVLEKIAGGVVRVGGFELVRLFGRQVLDPGSGLVMKLRPIAFALAIHELKRVRTEAVHMPEPVRSAAVACAATYKGKKKQ
jgi:hypothetical protein